MDSELTQRLGSTKWAHEHNCLIVELSRSLDAVRRRLDELEVAGPKINPQRGPYRELAAPAPAPVTAEGRVCDEATLRAVISLVWANSRDEYSDAAVVDLLESFIGQPLPTGVTP